MSHYKLKSPSDSVRFYLEIALKLDRDLQQARDILEAIDPTRSGP